MGIIGTVTHPFKTWINDFANSISGAFVSMQETTIKMLIDTSLPSFPVISSDWFTVRLGSTFGLASSLTSLFAVVIALIIVFTPTRNHGRKIGRTVSSFLLLLLFVVFFFPAYDLLVEFSRGMSAGILNLAEGVSDANKDSLVSSLVSVGVPGNPWGKIGAAIIGGGFGFFTICEVLSLNLLMIVVLMFYPLAIAIRPLGQKANHLFNAFNSAMLTVVLSTPLMVFFYALPILAAKVIPYGIGSAAVTQIFLALLGGILAMLVPFVLGWWLFKQSSEIFGSLDASIAGTVDIGSMPNVTTEEINKSAEDEHSSALRVFAGEAVAGAVGADLLRGDALLSDVKNVVVDAAAAASVAVGHPYIGVAIKTVDNITKPH